MKAFVAKDGNPKTHFKRSCKICVESHCKCTLPFRKMRKVRLYKAMMDKPILFKAFVRIDFL